MLVALFVCFAFTDSLVCRQIMGKSAQLAFPGYGSCHRCLMSWALVDGHDTFYTTSKTHYDDGTNAVTSRMGCFPLCERCWKELKTPAARMPYYRELYEEWESLGVVRDWELIQKAVMEEGIDDTMKCL